MSKIMRAMKKRRDGRKSRVGLWDRIRAKRARGGKMRKPGSPGAPTDKAFKDSQK